MSADSPRPPASPLYGHRAIAAHLGFTPDQVNAMLRQRRLPAFYLHGRLVGTTAALDDYLEVAK